MRKAAQGRVLLGRHAAALRRLLTALTIAIAAVAAGALPATAAPGDISTVAGDGTFGSSGDGGPATAASIGSPEGVFFSPAGLHLLDDAGPRVRYVDLAGTISTAAGGGLNDPGDGGPATQALLQDPEQVIRDRNGNLYFSAGNRVRRVSTLGIITTVAGTGTAGFSGDGGPATAAELARPHGLALDLNGNLYIGDCDNYRIRRVSSLGVITTVAGTGTLGYSGDGGPATAAQLSCPADVSVDPWGRLFIADNGNNVVRLVDPSHRQHLDVRGDGRQRLLRRRWTRHGGRAAPAAGSRDRRDWKPLHRRGAQSHHPEGRRRRDDHDRGGNRGGGGQRE